MPIDKNIPMPNPTPFMGLGGRMSSYPFMEMEIGDSAFFEGENNLGPAYSIAKKYASRSGDRKFSGRKVDGGYRIWRTA